jgi:hypothetical protein
MTTLILALLLQAASWPDQGIGAHPDSFKDIKPTAPVQADRWSSSVITLPEPGEVAIFAYPHRDRSFDTRCVIVLARGSKEGWLIDRVARTVMTFTHNPKAYAGGAPKWCDEKGKPK